MKLLDPAVSNVSRSQDVLRESWNVSSRECGVQILITEACDPTPEEIALVGDDTSLPGEYKVVSWPIVAFLRRNRFCAMGDDKEWFGAAIDGNLELITTWALTVEHAAGTTSWTNGTGVQTVSLAATPTVAQRVTAIADGRRQWLKTVSTPDKDKGPIMHVPPSHAADLKVAGVLDNADRNIWGDRVVIGQGYDEHPQVFWTGKINIWLGRRTVDQVPRAEMNDLVTAGDQVMAIGIPPCSIVRVGAYS